MRIEDIKEGVTYHNGKGLQRTVVRLEKGRYLNSFNVIWKKPGKEKENVCWCSTFADWAKGEVHEEELNFMLKCSCGKEVEGFFGNNDSEETLHCDCGYEWRIPRPVKP